MSRKRQKTLEKIFENPIRSDIKWSEVESLLLSLGSTIMEGSGSRARIELNNIKFHLHKPHPRPCLKKCQVRDLREFLESAAKE
jgi:hypothetical protein